MHNASQHTVIFHQAALGDFVLTFPVIRGLDGPIILVAPWSKANLAAKMFDHVTPFDIELREFSRLHQPGGPVALGPAVKEIFTQARRIISFISDGHDAWFENVTRLSEKAAVACIAARAPQSFTGHITAWHRRRLHEHGIEPAMAPVPTTNHSAGPVVIHPGSGGADKCWPAERFEKLIARLRKAGHEVQVLLGEVELATWSKPVLERWVRDYLAEPLLDLAQLHQRLAGARLFVGNDSGPTHLAGQMGLPTAALFGPTSPTRWRPVGPGVSVLAPPTPAAMTWLAVDKLADHIDAMLAS